MKELKIRESVPMTQGGPARVVSRIGEGGQGIVYKVDWNGGQYALKWFPDRESDAFRKNLEQNCSRKSPSPSFLWPLAMTASNSDNFGYVMRLVPQGYYPMSDFLLAKVQFQGFAQILQASLSILKSFKILHETGYSYQDINDGNFLINPDTGDVLIGDTDNVSVNNTNFGIQGKSRYLAAEVIDGGIPNIASDQMSLAIILYMLFMADHPFEGNMTLRIPCLTDEYEHRFYGREAVFCYDPTNPINRPHEQVQRNSIRRWKVMPQQIRDIFSKALSKEAITNPGARVREREWLSVLLEMRRLLVNCPRCGHDFLAGTLAPVHSCWCGSKVDTGLVLVFPEGRYVLTEGKKLYLSDSLSPVGTCCTTGTGPFKEKALRNDTPDIWKLTTARGTAREIRPGEMFPLREGMQIRFNDATLGTVARLR